LAGALGLAGGALRSLPLLSSSSSSEPSGFIPGASFGAIATEEDTARVSCAEFVRIFRKNAHAPSLSRSLGSLLLAR
jgi:hypothetical protein